MWLDCSHQERTLEIHQSLVLWGCDNNLRVAHLNGLGQRGKVVILVFYEVQYDCWMLDGLERGAHVHRGVYGVK